jgi:hypothetical protein
LSNSGRPELHITPHSRIGPIGPRSDARIFEGAESGGQPCIGLLIERGVKQTNEIEDIANKIEKIYLEKLQLLGFEQKDISDPAYPKQALPLLEIAKGISDTITNPKLKLF